VDYLRIFSFRHLSLDSQRVDHPQVSLPQDNLISSNREVGIGDESSWFHYSSTLSRLRVAFGSKGLHTLLIYNKMMITFKRTMLHIIVCENSEEKIFWVIDAQ
jgi:hypothetical protein